MGVIERRNRSSSPDEKHAARRDEHHGMSSTSDEAPVVIVGRLILSQYTRIVGSEGEDDIPLSQGSRCL